MKGNIVLLYGRLHSILSFEKFLQSIGHYLSKLSIMLTKLQAMGERFDSVMLKALSATGKHILGRELSEAEKAKFMFFLHKVALFCLIAGYFIGYLVGR